MLLPVRRLVTATQALQAAHQPLMPPRAMAATRMAARKQDGDDTSQQQQQQLDQLAQKAAALGVAATLAWGCLAPLAAQAAPAQVAFSYMLQEIQDKKVENLQFSPDERSVFLTTTDGSQQVAAVLPSAQEKLVDLLLENDVNFRAAPSVNPNPMSNNLVGSILSAIGRNFFPISLLLLLFLPRILSGMGIGEGGDGGGMGGMGNPFEISKSKATLAMEPNTGVKFDDVAGCDGSKMELKEVVEFLTNPGKYEKVGARAPRGVIMEGPPGTGKTLLARAVAGEAGVPFISCSGSEFVEMFVGVGASRVRDIFAKAKKNAPCIIFIDEIDAVAKRRAGSGGGPQRGNDEQEQTLNQILTEMDGFSGNTGIVVMAATNRADVLDPALLRPGRFDRRVPVDLPDRVGREAILKVHARSKPLDESVDLAKLAARTTGFSGASLSNLLNEAAIVTARRDKSEITMSEVEYALDRLEVGMEKATGMASATRRKLVATHEAGHAIMGALTPGFDEVAKVTIVPRSSGAGGFTLFLPTDERSDSGLYSRAFLESRLQVALGGRVAEELEFGADDITTGASNDLQQVADLARRMVTQWGFASEALGPTAWEPPQRDFGSPTMASQKTEARIDAEVSKIVAAAYDKCRATLAANKRLLDEVVKALVVDETIDSAVLNDLVATYKNAEGPVVATV